MTSMYMPQILNNMQHKLVNVLMIMIFFGENTDQSFQNDSFWMRKL